MLKNFLNYFKKMRQNNNKMIFMFNPSSLPVNFLESLNLKVFLMNRSLFTFAPVATTSFSNADEFLYFFEPLEQFEIVNRFVNTENVFIMNFFNIFFYSHLIPAITFFFFLIFIFTNSFSVSNFTISNLLTFKLTNNLFLSNTQFSFENQNSFFFIYFLFMFILYHNFSGMFPFSYTTTSLILASFFLSMTAFFFVLVVNVNQNGWFFFDHFLPAGVSIQGARWMIIIEIISFFMRVVSLGVRLFANLLSGHILLKVLIGFFILGVSFFFLKNSTILLFTILFLYFIILLLITALELFISFLQSYTFVFLTIIYFSEIFKGLPKFNFLTYSFMHNDRLRINLDSIYNKQILNTSAIYILLNNSPKTAQLYFQEAGSLLMNELISFHDDVMYIITFIVIFVMYALLSLIVNFFMNEGEAFKNYIKKYKINHNSTLEIIWTVVPAVILLIIVVPSFSLLYYNSNTYSKNNQTSFVVKVIGHQWYWTYEYIDSNDNSVVFDSYLLPVDELTFGSFRNLEVNNRLALPTDSQIRVLLTSVDVIHSWAVPGFGVKIDACPGRLNEIVVNINKSGVYYGQCSEICGLNHGFMPIVIEAFNFLPTDDELLEDIENDLFFSMLVEQDEEEDRLDEIFYNWYTSEPNYNVYCPVTPARSADDNDIQWTFLVKKEIIDNLVADSENSQSLYDEFFYIIAEQEGLIENFLIIKDLDSEIDKVVTDFLEEVEFDVLRIEPTHPFYHNITLLLDAREVFFTTYEDSLDKVVDRFYYYPNETIPELFFNVAFLNAEYENLEVVHDDLHIVLNDNLYLIEGNSIFASQGYDWFIISGDVFNLIPDIDCYECSRFLSESQREAYLQDIIEIIIMDLEEEEGLTEILSLIHSPDFEFVLLEILELVYGDEDTVIDEEIYGNKCTTCVEKQKEEN